MTDPLEPLSNAIDLGHRAHIAAAIKSVSDRDLAPSKIVPFVLRRFCATCLRRDNLWALRALYRCVERLERHEPNSHRAAVVDALELVMACGEDDDDDAFFVPSCDLKTEERCARLARIQRIVDAASDDPPHPCIVRGFRDGLLPSCLPLMQRLVERCVTGTCDDDARCIAWYLLLYARPRHLFIDPKNVIGMRDGTDALFRVLLDVANDADDDTLLRYVVLCKDLYYHRRQRTERWALAWAACRALLERGRTLQHQEHDLVSRNGLRRPPAVNPLFVYTYRTDATTPRMQNMHRSRDVVRTVGIPGDTASADLRVQRLRSEDTTMSGGARNGSYVYG